MPPISATAATAATGAAGAGAAGAGAGIWSGAGAAGISMLGNGLTAGLMGGGGEKERFGKETRAGLTTDNLTKYYSMILRNNQANLNANYWGPQKNIAYANATGQYRPGTAQEKMRLAQNQRKAGTEGALGAYMAKPKGADAVTTARGFKDFSQGKTPQNTYQPIDYGKAYNEGVAKEKAYQDKVTPQEIQGMLAVANTAYEQLKYWFYGPGGDGFNTGRADELSGDQTVKPFLKFQRALEYLGDSHDPVGFIIKLIDNPSRHADIKGDTLFEKWEDSKLGSRAGKSEVFSKLFGGK